MYIQTYDIMLHPLFVVMVTITNFSLLYLHLSTHYICSRTTWGGRKGQRVHAISVFMSTFT